MINKTHAPKGYEEVDASQSNGAECSPENCPDGPKGEFTKRASTWVTVISEYNGFITTRDIGPYDTTIYADRILAEVPWLPGDEGPDHHAISLEMAKLGKEWRY